MQITKHDYEFMNKEIVRLERKAQVNSGKVELLLVLVVIIIPIVLLIGSIKYQVISRSVVTEQQKDYEDMRAHNVLLRRENEILKYGYSNTID